MTNAMLYVTATIESTSPNPIARAMLYVVFIVGTFKATSFVLSLIALMVDAFVLPPVQWSRYGASKIKGSGDWAVVTGASDGIGKEYALQLAQRGLNVVLVSRTQEKLEQLAHEIEDKHHVSTVVVAFDASIDNDEHYERLAEALNPLAVLVLINNVGQSHSMPVPFAETPLKEMRDIIAINDLATLRITATVLPVIQRTVANKKDKSLRGLILTMGLFGGLLPTPYLATYSGLKAFLQSWLAALAGELAPERIDVELVILYLVTLAMSKIRRLSATIPTPHDFVRLTLNSIGQRGGAQDRYATMTPYWSHALMHFFIENSVGVYSKVANALNRSMHLLIRSRALKKASKLAKTE